MNAGPAAPDTSAIAVHGGKAEQLAASLLGRGHRADVGVDRRPHHLVVGVAGLQEQAARCPAPRSGPEAAATRAARATRASACSAAR